MSDDPNDLNYGNHPARWRGNMARDGVFKAITNLHFPGTPLAGVKLLLKYGIVWTAGNLAGNYTSGLFIPDFWERDLFFRKTLFELGPLKQIVIPVSWFSGSVGIGAVLLMAGISANSKQDRHELSREYRKDHTLRDYRRDVDSDHTEHHACARPAVPGTLTKPPHIACTP